MALLTHDREDSLGDVQHPEEVYFELVAHLLLGHFLNHADEPLAGIVDHDVEVTEGDCSTLDGVTHGGAIGHVKRQGRNGLAVLGDQRANPGLGGPDVGKSAIHFWFGVDASKADRGCWVRPRDAGRHPWITRYVEEGALESALGTIHASSISTVSAAASEAEPLPVSVTTVVRMAAAAM